SGGNPTPIPENTPGTINATLYFHVQGSTPGPCGVSQRITWTANSTAGSPQTKATDPFNDTSKCDDYTPLEGSEKVTSCGCPVTMSFTNLAPGTWTITAGSIASCSATVKPGKTTVLSMFNDARPNRCQTFP